jgi:glucose-1-phosphate adenylyltransferase
LTLPDYDIGTVVEANEQESLLFMAVNMQKNVLGVILGGGVGSRLFPLTQQRAKPAVPLAGKYRLVDIPISNCINSDVKRVYVVTQFNSASLHRHISQSYKFDQFSSGFVEVLAAQQTLDDTSWYQGTADAVRKNLQHLLNHTAEYIVVLSGDQLYRMDFRQILQHHVDKQADLTVATLPVRREAAPGLGIMQIAPDDRIVRFVEKPKDPAVQDSLRLDHNLYGRLGMQGEEDFFLASMGIYVFNRQVLVEVLGGSESDFGKHIIPQAIDRRRVCSYVFQGYWEDIGTIRSFFEANIDVAAELPRFNFFDMTAPVFSRPRWLPGSKINGAAIDHAMVCDGCIINRAQISYSIIGIRSIVGAGARIMRTVMMGCDYYETLQSIADNEVKGIPRIGIGRNARIENAIIDKNARIGNNVVITPEGKAENLDHKLYYIRDGIVIIPKNGVVPDNTVI